MTLERSNGILWPPNGRTRGYVGTGWIRHVVYFGDDWARTACGRKPTNVLSVPRDGPVDCKTCLRAMGAGDD